jgi:hypothetical protein
MPTAIPDPDRILPDPGTHSRDSSRRGLERNEERHIGRGMLRKPVRCLRRRIQVPAFPYKRQERSWVHVVAGMVDLKKDSSDMKKAVLALATAATIGVTALVTPSPAQAWRGGWGPGLAGGLIAGAVIGGIASSAYAYGPGYGYYGGPGYDYYGGQGYGYGGYAPAYSGGYAPAYSNYGYVPAYYGGYRSSYYAPGYYGPRYRRVVRPAHW